jgi:hypothetical protein
MEIRVGQWVIDLRAGHFFVQFPVGETTVKVEYQDEGKAMPNMLWVEIDGKELFSVPLPISQEDIIPDA